VQLLGTDDGWAWGNDINHGPLALHLQNGVWSPVTFAPSHTGAALAYAMPLSQTPSSQLAIQAAQFLSDTEGWAIGQDGPDDIVWRFHNGQWQTALRSTQSSGGAFFGLGANSVTDVWVLGDAGAANAINSAKMTYTTTNMAYHPLASLSNGGAPVLLHFDGQRWTSASVDITAGPSFFCGATWLARYDSVNQRQMVVGLLLNQGGTWHPTTFAQPVTGVISVTTQPDGSTLAVVVTGAESGPQDLHILRYANGAWSGGA
jgi:hypothetical protein